MSLTMVFGSFIAGASESVELVFSPGDEAEGEDAFGSAEFGEPIRGEFTPGALGPDELGDEAGGAGS